MKVLVTGANGFIGSRLVCELLRRNYEVLCLVRKSSNLKLLSGLNVSYIYGSIDDKASLENAFLALKDSFPEYIIHCAGLIKARTREEYFIANAEGTKNLAEACLPYREKIKRFVHISSLAAAGPGTKDFPRREKDTLNAITFYGQSKLAGEKELKKFFPLIPSTILRPTAIYGPGDQGIYKFFQMINLGIMPLAGNADMEISVVFVDDLISAVFLVMEKESAIGETFFVADENGYRVRDILLEIKKAMGKKTIPLVLPQGLLSFIAVFSESIMGLFGKSTLFNRQKIIEMTQKGWICSTEKIKNIGFKTKYDLKLGVEETIKWYRENGWL